MQDVITRDITVKATKERVYAAITDPAQLITWFPDAVEGKLEVGQQPVFDFGTHGKSQIYVQDAKPFSYFSYRWVPGGNGIVGVDVLSVPTTLVEFFIDEHAEGTKVTVKESGFASLPQEIAEESFKQNSGGWKIMMDGLEKIMNLK